MLTNVSPQAGKDQNGKNLAVKAPRRDMKNFKNVDSKLASLILNEIVERYFFYHIGICTFYGMLYSKENVVNF